MAIIVDETSRILIQGITGTVGKEFARRMRLDGSPLVAGVVPGRGGTEVEGVPVFDSVFAARDATGADFSLVAAPVSSAADATSEALAAGMRTVVVYTEGIPTPYSLGLNAQARASGATLLGPASAGVVSPCRANVSDLREAWLRRGPVGVVSRSGTLVYEVTAPLVDLGCGLSTVCCLGGDVVVGTRYADVLRLFAQDPETEAVVLLGEIGGAAEIEAARVIETMDKPIVAYIAGRHAPTGTPIGHAGALVAKPEDRADYKAEVLQRAGARIVHNILDVAPAVLAALDESG
jgi:succinyl-CoA synthetase alpha subunit